jgi:DNA-binding transcriptional MocR family regulator
MSYQKTKSALRAKGLSVTERLVLAQICTFHNEKTGQCNPSYQTLASALEINRVTVWRAIVSLESKGLIECRRSDKQKSTQYIINGWPENSLGGCTEQPEVVAYRNQLHSATSCTPQPEVVALCNMGGCTVQPEQIKEQRSLNREKITPYIPPTPEASGAPPSAATGMGAAATEDPDELPLAIDPEPDPEQTPPPKRQTRKASALAFAQDFVTSRFWPAWPKHERKRGKHEVTQKLAAILADSKGDFEETAQAILDGLARYKTSAAWVKDRGKWIPGPVPWLNKRSWEDPDVLQASEAVSPNGRNLNGEYIDPDTGEELSWI